MKKEIVFGSLTGLEILLVVGCSNRKNIDIHHDRPNIIIVNIDDMGYGDIEPFGSTLNRTPNLSKMAEGGAIFTSFYAAPVCSPSRAALMTGCYPKRVLPLAQNVFYPGDHEGLSPNEITIAEILKEQGYTTGIIGKWHLGDQPEFLPTKQGFDYYFGMPYSNDMGPIEDGARNSHGSPQGSNPGKNHKWAEGYPPIPFIKNNSFVKRVLSEDQQRCVATYTDEAIQFIQKNYQKPFFLYLAHTAVHWPYYPGKDFLGKSENCLYGDWIEEIDWSIGQIQKKIGELAIENKTIVIFTSDNGASSPGSNYPLRGFKGSVWEGGVRVPFIIQWPGKIVLGLKISVIAGMMDILPTLAEISGCTVPHDRKIDGQSLYPLLTGEMTAQPPHDVYYFYRTLQLQAVRKGKWKLHLLSGELYNLEEDISESRNIATANANIVYELNLIANMMDNDLGKGGPSIFEGLGPGCRPLGYVLDAKPVIDKNGNIRDDFLIKEDF